MSTTIERVERSTPSQGSTVHVVDPRREWTRFIAGLGALTILSVLGTLTSVALLIGMLPAWQGVAITSGSMRPGIVEGDLVLVNRAPALIKEGQVVTFVDPGTSDLTTHRIVGVDPGGAITTRGDANSIPDPTSVQADGVVGAARFIVPYVGLPAYWLSSGNGLALVALVAVGAGLTFIARFAFRDGIAAHGSPRP